MKIDDVSPREDNTTRSLSRDFQSVSGRALCCAISADGTRAYVGGHSGVWRSDDGGANWIHHDRPQPAPGQSAVPGALLAHNVYDLLISPASPDVVLAATGRNARRPDPSGIYRSEDGARSWTRVHAARLDPSGGATAEAFGSLAVAADDPQLMFAAGGGVARSSNGGKTWTELPPPPGFFGNLWYVVAGQREGGFRRVYAIGRGVTYSVDGGNSWLVDPHPLNIGPPTDALGASSRSVSIHPRNPAIVYVLIGDGKELWRGQFPPLPSTGPGIWTQLATPSKEQPGTTPSGGGFVIAHVTPEGQLHLIVSDRRATHSAAGEPATQAGWRRIEDVNCHLDPHGFAMTPDFRPHLPDGSMPAARGRALLINDGGVNFTTDGALSWGNGRGLSTLGIVNAAVNVARNRPVALCIGMGDNSGFSSRDGAGSWKTQHYLGGDNDCCFADPLQPERLIVFSPRFGPPNERKGWLAYVASSGDTPDAALGTQQVHVVEAPPALGEPGLRNRGHNLVSNFVGAGYRPLVPTRVGEAPRPDGDVVLIRFTSSEALLMRTTRTSQITAPSDWVTTATTESAITFRQGPALPHKGVSIVQASGGHAAPTFFVGDQLGPVRDMPAVVSVWKWTSGAPAWQRIVPAAGRGPARALRYFVDPYRPSLIYVLADDAIWRSDDGGTSWIEDAPLQRALTEDGAFPLGVGKAGISDGTPDPVLLRDMQFDPFRPECRFAMGPAGIFHTQDGRGWTTLLRASAVSTHVSNAVYDPISCDRALYVATFGRGLLRLAPIPPDWDFPIGSLRATSGRITFLRVHDVGTGFGPDHDRLDAEVIVRLDSEPEKAFGLKLRAGADMLKARGMLDLLRDAFGRGAAVQLEFVRSSCRNGEIIRVIET